MVLHPLLWLSVLGGFSFFYNQWGPVSSIGTKASLRGVHITGDGVLWASGSEGTILHGTNDGLAWRRCAVPASAEKLDFRGVWGFDANRAIIMSSGPGNASRLYQTSDGCYSWRLLFTNPDPAGFWDAIAFDGEKGVLLGDPVDNRFVIYITADGGKHWIRDKSTALTADPKGEGAFAASNSVLAIRLDKKILFGTGGPGVLVQPEMERGRSPLVSIPPFGRGFSRHPGLPIRCGF
jgi:photosystem II stability/assembly factor-like uncharacterized protein